MGDSHCQRNITSSLITHPPLTLHPHTSTQSYMPSLITHTCYTITHHAESGSSFNAPWEHVQHLNKHGGWGRGDSLYMAEKSPRCMGKRGGRGREGEAGMGVKWPARKNLELIYNTPPPSPPLEPQTQEEGVGKFNSQREEENCKSSA